MRALARVRAVASFAGRRSISYARPHVVATAAEAAAAATSGHGSVVVVDASPIESYKKAHIRGAVHVGVASTLKGANSRLLMAPADFQAAMRALGIGADTTVIAYDAHHSMYAARLFWALKTYGHANVKVLQDNFDGYARAGLPVSTMPEAPTEAALREALRVPFVAKPQAAWVATADEVHTRSLANNTYIVDVRSKGEFIGTDARGNTRVGHVPHAHNLVHTELIGTADRWLDQGAIEAVAKHHGLEDKARGAVTYCQTGIRAAHTFFMLHLAGFEHVKNYDGSMAEYLNDTHFPVAK